jgi:16S rRNA (uracil1498-N3)-methyltransferase
MKTARFFSDTINQNDAVTISDVQFRHLTKVLRFKQGDSVELFDGKGIVANAVIEKISKDTALLKVQDLKVFDSENRRKIIIASSIAKAHKFELIIAKCTELGIDRIAPVIFQRTVKQADSEMSARRFESIAVESAKQCGRIFLSVIDRPLNLEKALGNLRIDYPQAKIIFGSLEENVESIINFDFDSAVVAFIGPEGGLTEAEENLLKKADAEPLRLTDTILRIETAAIAFASILAAKRNANI